MQRELIRERTLDGRAAAAAQDRKGGSLYRWTPTPWLLPSSRRNAAGPVQLLGWASSKFATANDAVGQRNGRTRPPEPISADLLSSLCQLPDSWAYVDRNRIGAASQGRAIRKERRSLATYVLGCRRSELHEAYHSGIPSQLGTVGVMIKAIALWNRGSSRRGIESATRARDIRCANRTSCACARTGAPISSPWVCPRRGWHFS